MPHSFVRGGGLAAGVGAYLKSHCSDTRIFTAEPEGWHDHYLSFQRGERVEAPGNGARWCDGLLAPTPGNSLFLLIKPTAPRVSRRPLNGWPRP
ncbi:MAG: hypothetical protein CM15mP84_07600 [Cellvibrionales bacterium]|nr:MAG: hypothetical protein CM15mP84_07600 [Cellvibrionales bacterium]